MAQYARILVVGLVATLALVVGPALSATPGQAVHASDGPYYEVASGYGPGLWGNLTASGEVLYYGSYYAASPSLPFGTTLTVCYEGCVDVVIMDRGPYVAGRTLDLEYAAAEAIGLAPYVGVDTVEVYYH